MSRDGRPEDGDRASTGEAGESVTAPDWVAASLERDWTEGFLNGEVTLPTRPAPPPSPAGPAPRNRAERRAAS